MFSFLSFQPSRTGHSRTITHDIPVIVMPRRQWEEYTEPTLPDFDVSLLLQAYPFEQSSFEKQS